MTINSPNDSLERRTMLSEILNVLAFVDVTVPRNVDDDIGTVDNALIE